MQRLGFLLLVLVASLTPSTRTRAQRLDAPAARLTSAQIERCYRAVYEGLRPIARVEVPSRQRDAVIFALIARAPCPAWSARMRELARLILRGDARRLVRLLNDHQDDRCNVLGTREGACAPHHVDVRGVDASQGLSGSEGQERLVLVRAIDELSAYPELVPLAQLLWGFGDYNGRCVTPDTASMHDAVRRGLVRRVLFTPPSGRRRADVARQLYGSDDEGRTTP